MSDDDEPPTCVDCKTTGDDVMDRVVGNTAHSLCADCADIRRRMPGQERASEPPGELRKVWGGPR